MSDYIVISEGSMGVQGATGATGPTGDITAGHGTMTGAEQGPILVLNNGVDSNYLEFAKTGHTVKGSVGALGAFEMNISYNMDYKTGIHKYYDSTENAHWIAMNDNGIYLQYAPKNYVTDGDIWDEQGRLYNWRVDPSGHQTIGGHLTIGEHLTDFAVIETANTTASLALNTNQSMVFNINAIGSNPGTSYFWGVGRSRLTDGTTLMKLTSDGHLGLKVTDPQTTLHTGGNTIIGVDGAGATTSWLGNKQCLIWLLDDTTLRFSVKGSDGVTRAASLTLV